MPLLRRGLNVCDGSLLSVRSVCDGLDRDKRTNQGCEC
jgi:hypothetical protein